MRDSVERLDGEVRLDSEPGRGTRISMRIPLVLSRTRALVFRAGQQAYALPTTTVERVLDLPGGAVAGRRGRGGAGGGVRGGLGRGRA